MSVRKEIISGLIDALDDVKSNNDYPIKIKSINEFDENYLTFENYQVPAIFVNDTGVEELMARDDDSYKYSLDFILVGFVHANSKSGLRLKLNDTQSFIKQFLDSTSGATVHANCQSLEYESSESMYFQSDSDPDKIMGMCSINVSMRYYIADGAF